MIIYFFLQQYSEGEQLIQKVNNSLNVQMNVTNKPQSVYIQVGLTKMTFYQINDVNICSIDKSILRVTVTKHFRVNDSIILHNK